MQQTVIACWARVALPCTPSVAPKASVAKRQADTPNKPKEKTSTETEPSKAPEAHQNDQPKQPRGDRTVGSPTSETASESPETQDAPPKRVR